MKSPGTVAFRDFVLVPVVGLEPTHLSVHDFESRSSAIPTHRRYLRTKNSIMIFADKVKRCVEKTSKTVRKGQCGLAGSERLPAGRGDF